MTLALPILLAIMVLQSHDDPNDGNYVTGIPDSMLMEAALEKIMLGNGCVVARTNRGARPNWGAGRELDWWRNPPTTAAYIYV